MNIINNTAIIQANTSKLNMTLRRGRVKPSTPRERGDLEVKPITKHAIVDFCSPVANRKEAISHNIE